MILAHSGSTVGCGESESESDHAKAIEWLTEIKNLDK